MRERLIPSLDFLRGFDAAARRLSFTEAAGELFVTQSALSRQIQALEQQIGVQLFVRGHRSLKLTEAGAALQPVVRDILADLARAIARVRARHGVRKVNVSTTIPFASLWLIRRLPRFRDAHPDVEVFVSADNQIVDLERGDIDVAVRYSSPDRVPAEAMHLFGERVVPVASPALIDDRRRPLKKPADLSKHLLLHLDDPLGRTPWIDWNVWLTSSGIAGLEAAGNLRFSQYDLLLQAAVSGQGVALGRRPLIDDVIARGELVAPFATRYDAPRGYFALAAARSDTRPEIRQFIAWLAEEAAGTAAADFGDKPVVRVKPRVRRPRAAESRPQRSRHQRP